MGGSRAHLTHPIPVQTYVTEDDYKRLSAVAKKHDRSIASYLRILLISEMTREENAQPNQPGAGRIR
jgi:hypothetical protein